MPFTFILFFTGLVIEGSSSDSWHLEAAELFLKKNQNAPGSSEHPPVRGKNVGCKHITSSWHLNGFPYRSNIGSTV